MVSMTRSLKKKIAGKQPQCSSNLPTISSTRVNTFFTDQSLFKVLSWKERLQATISQQVL